MINGDVFFTSKILKIHMFLKLIKLIYFNKNIGHILTE